MSPGARVDSSGKPACELCGARLGKKKQHHYVNGRIHGQQCSPQCKRAARPAAVGGWRAHHAAAAEAASAVLAAVSVPVPSVPSSPTPVLGAKRSIGEDTAADTFEPAAQRAALDTEAWDYCHVAIVPNVGAAVAARWLRVRGGKQMIIRGNVRQADQSAANTELLADTEAVARAEMDKLGIDTGKLQRGDVKLLKAARGHGKQEAHMDIADCSTARRCYTFLLYLTRTYSTMVSFLSEAEREAAFAMSPEEGMEAYSEEKHFHNKLVQSGTIAVFRDDVMHFGVENIFPEERKVLFIHFYPTDMQRPNTDGLQRFIFGTDF